MHDLAMLWKYHPALVGVIGTAVANAAITSLPSPDEKSGKFYRWFFATAHALILAIPRLVAQYGGETGQKGTANSARENE